jgi:hypothetical protein
MQERSLGPLASQQKHCGLLGGNIISGHLNVDVAMISGISSYDQTPSHVHRRPSYSGRNRYKYLQRDEHVL